MALPSNPPVPSEAASASDPSLRIHSQDSIAVPVPTQNTAFLADIPTAGKMQPDWRSVVEDASFGVMVGQAGKVRYLNRTARVIVGLEPDERLPTDEILKYVHPDDLHIVNRAREQRNAGVYVAPYQHRLGKPGGPYRWVEISGQVIDWEGINANLIFFRDITEERNLEKRLAATEAFFQPVVEGAPIGIMVAQEDKYVYVNSPASQMFGRSREQLVGFNPLIFVHPDDRAYAMELALQSRQRTLQPPYRVRMVRPDNSVVWIEVKPAHIKWGGRSARLGFVTDVTDQTRLADALQTSETQYRAVVDNSNQAIYVTVNRKVQYANPTALRLLDHLERPFIGSDAVDLVLPQQRDMLLRQRERIQRGEVVPPFEVNYHRADQTAGVAEMYGVPFQWQGMPALLVFMNDVSDRHRFLDALADSEYKFRQIVEQATDGILIGREHQLLYANPKFFQMFRLDQSKFDQVSWDYLCLEGDGERLRQEVADYVMSQRDTPIEAQPWYSTVDEEVWFEIRVSRVHWQGKGATLMMLSDMTQRRRATQETVRALARERELSELKSRFVSMTSHEFRTPLATIVSSTELLEHYHDKFDKAERESIMADIRAAAKRMNTMLEDVLALTRAESAQTVLRCGAVDLAKLAGNCLNEALVAHPGVQDAAFVCTPEVTVLAANAWVDERLIRQILGNLLVNACKYTPSIGKVILALEQAIYQGQEVWVFVVSDTGIGVSAADQQRVFEGFYRGANVGNIPGTGLGLAIVHRAVQLHGGHIEFMSEVGVGTTVTVHIPKAIESTAPKLIDL